MELRSKENYFKLRRHFENTGSDEKKVLKKKKIKIAYIFKYEKYLRFNRLDL